MDFSFHPAGLAFFALLVLQLHAYSRLKLQMQKRFPLQAKTMSRRAFWDWLEDEVEKNGPQAPTLQRFKSSYRTYQRISVVLLVVAVLLLLSAEPVHL